MLVNNDIGKLKFVIAGYDIPAIYVIQKLFSYRVKPEQILLITHKEDSRNISLISFARLRKLEILFFDAKSKELLEKYTSFAPDILFSIHFRERIPGSFLKVPRLGAINLHPSLLPSYRGTNSIPWQIINGEAVTGYTWHYMDEHFDTGDILLQEKIDITSDETAFSLFHKQIITSIGKFDEVLQMVYSGYVGVKQSKLNESYYKRSLPFNGIIDKNWEIDKIDRFIRAMYFPPFSPALVELDGNKYEVTDIQMYKNIIK